MFFHVHVYLIVPRLFPCKHALCDWSMHLSTTFSNSNCSLKLVYAIYKLIFCSRVTITEVTVRERESTRVCGCYQGSQGRIDTYMLVQRQLYMHGRRERDWRWSYHWHTPRNRGMHVHVLTSGNSTLWQISGSQLQSSGKYGRRERGAMPHWHVHPQDCSELHLHSPRSEHICNTCMQGAYTISMDSLYHNWVSGSKPA